VTQHQPGSVPTAEPAVSTAPTGPTAPGTADPAAGGSAVPPPADLNELRLEIDRIDAELLRLIKRRTDVSRTIGAIRRAAGGPRVVHTREITVLERFSELGPEGAQLALLLLQLGRGRLGVRAGA
jgi:chorismate mutase